MQFHPQGGCCEKSEEIAGLSEVAMLRGPLYSELEIDFLYAIAVDGLEVVPHGNDVVTGFVSGFCLLHPATRVTMKTMPSKNGGCEVMTIRISVTMFLQVQGLPLSWI